MTFELYRTINAQRSELGENTVECAWQYNSTTHHVVAEGALQGERYEAEQKHGGDRLSNTQSRLLIGPNETAERGRLRVLAWEGERHCDDAGTCAGDQSGRPCSVGGAVYAERRADCESRKVLPLGA